METVALNRLCDQAAAVVALRDLGVAGPWQPNELIGLRHDCDDNAFESMYAMANWEAKWGIRSTYYLLHTAPWYDLTDPECVSAIVAIGELGHEIGLHINWVPAWEHDRTPARETVARELAKLRAVWPHVHSVAGHGDDACYRTNLVNYSMFEESGPAKPPWVDFGVATGARRSTLGDFGLDFLAEFVSKGAYVSDSGGEWSQDLYAVADGFPYERGPLVILQHPDWYRAEQYA